MLANDQVEEADEFEAQELSKGLLILLTSLVLFLVIVRGVTEVIVAIDLLIYACSLQEVSCLEELSSNPLEVLDALQLPRDGLLVEVLILADPYEGQMN